MANSRTVVIGNENCVLGFALLGVTGYVVRADTDMDRALNASLGDRNVGIVLISSDAAALARERVDKLRINSINPLVVEIPGQDATRGMPSLKERVQAAVGITLGN